MRKALAVARFSIVVGSLVASVAASEAALRVLRPDLADLVHSTLRPDRYRIHANPRGTAELHHSPEKGGGQHLVVHNSLGFRQHREFTRQKGPGVVRIGVFGDSYAENLRMPVQYSFTEPLDFLLNQTGGSWEVLNFGTDGYGTDQVYLQYLDEGVALDLDVVLYVYCHNDLIDIIADRLIDVDERGDLRYLPVRRTSPFIETIKRFYLTYFLMESSAVAKEELAAVLAPRYEPETLENSDGDHQAQRHLNHLFKRDPNNPERAHAFRIFRALVAALQHKTERRSQKFFVVMLPFQQSDPDARALLQEMGVPVIDLAPPFAAEVADRHEVFFQHDPHWNEEGNKLAAVHIFQSLARALDVAYPGDGFIRGALSRYYAAFGHSRVSEHWLEPVESDEASKSAVRAKYLALELAPFSG